MNRQSGRRQAGAALLAAMLTVTLVATFAAAALWQQWRNLEIESADRTRVQSEWILTGALDWARLILREDGADYDHLGEPWAVPLQEARLSTFLAADRSNNADTGDADAVFLSGEISDLQARLNISNLVQAGARDTKGVAAFLRLFEALGLPQEQVGVMADNLRLAVESSIDSAAGAAPLVPQRVAQLAWLGLPAETVAALEPYVTVLQPHTAVNLNTASAEVIYAAAACEPGKPTCKEMSMAEAQRLVAERQRQPFRSLADATKLLARTEQFEGTAVSVNSRFFLVRGRLRINDVTIEEQSVVQRDGKVVRTLRRERGTGESLAPAPARR
jgi:general secretion pathway protein K